MMKEAFAKRAEENKRATRERQTASRQSSRLDDFVLGSQREINKKHPKNIRVAINKLGVILRHNEFSNQTEIFGLPNFGLELTDPGAVRLRFWIGETYGFLPPLDLYEQVLMDIAHQNKSNPVRDFRDGLKWDGVQDRQLAAGLCRRVGHRI
jgi:predicted P-loop ATPase